MSHAFGKVHFVDGLVLHYEYDGTSDVTIPRLYTTANEVAANWRRVDDWVWNCCTCGKDEPVKIYSSYGGGFSWDGRACRHCQCIVAGYEPVFDEEDFSMKEEYHVK